MQIRLDYYKKIGTYPDHQTAIIHNIDSVSLPFEQTWTIACNIACHYLGDGFSVKFKVEDQGRGAAYILFIKNLDKNNYPYFILNREQYNNAGIPSEFVHWRSV